LDRTSSRLRLLIPRAFIIDYELGVNENASYPQAIHR
jgi:hypothetical protein